MQLSEWTPGEPLEAECRFEVWRWRFVRFGMTFEEARESVERHNAEVEKWNEHANQWRELMPVPLVAPPPPMGLHCFREPVHDDAPEVHCGCGIYGLHEPDEAYRWGEIQGTVAVWGRVIPGERGARGQYAYPVELRVPHHLAEDPALLAYGVPLIGDNLPVDPLREASRARRRATIFLSVAVAANLTAAAWNIAGALWL